jgi:hypothetical protein
MVYAPVVAIDELPDCGVPRLFRLLFIRPFVGILMDQIEKTEPVVASLARTNVFGFFDQPNVFEFLEHAFGRNHASTSKASHGIRIDILP